MAVVGVNVEVDAAPLLSYATEFRIPVMSLCIQPVFYRLWEGCEDQPEDFQRMITPAYPHIRNGLDQDTVGQRRLPPLIDFKRLDTTDTAKISRARK